MSPVYQTKHGHPGGNCLAACVATLLDKPIEAVDVDVASCGNSLRNVLTQIEEKAQCRIYGFPHEAIVDGVVKSTERLCIVSVCSCVFNEDPFHPNSTWHSVVCEIGGDGKLALLFNPDRNDQRTHSLQQFRAIGNLLIVRRAHSS